MSRERRTVSVKKGGGRTHTKRWDEEGDMLMKKGNKNRNRRELTEGGRGEETGEREGRKDGRGGKKRIKIIQRGRGRKGPSGRERRSKGRKWDEVMGRTCRTNN